ncbi:hypothetical protein [Brevundimonas sp.]|uniref:hypothetical protein n=1 Tax=Brevundimonas sp. TaxID=1871086 RepID=UPI001D9E8B81|nr:hypothetical protein [Brevundimonas sp.]MBL0947569.1 hypothetical protein [Brevundimonas sp.]
MSGGLVEAVNALLKQPLRLSAICGGAAAMFLLADYKNLLPDFEDWGPLGSLIATGILLISVFTFVVVGLMRVAPLFSGWRYEADVKNRISKLPDESLVLLRSSLKGGNNQTWIKPDYPGIEPLRRKALVEVDTSVPGVVAVACHGPVWAVLVKNYEKYTTRPVSDDVRQEFTAALSHAWWALDQAGYDHNGRPVKA